MPHYTTFDANQSTPPAQVISVPRAAAPVLPKSLAVPPPTSSNANQPPYGGRTTWMPDGSIDLAHGSVIAHPSLPMPDKSSASPAAIDIVTLEPAKPFPTSPDSLQNNSANSGQETSPNMGAQGSGGNGGLFFGNGGSGK